MKAYLVISSILLLCGGCFEPAVTCGLGGVCPDGLACDVAGAVCRAPDDCADCRPAFAFTARQQASDQAPNDEFGFSVAAGGDRFIVGAWADAAHVGGAAYVFSRQGASWVEEARLAAPEPAPEDEFGAAVALTGDLAVVGARQSDVVQENAGSVEIFEQDAGVWTHIQTIPGAIADDHFGCAVAASGQVVVVGVCNADSPELDAGAANVYERPAAAFSSFGVLTPADAAQGDNVGSSVAVDGTTMVIGAPGDDDRGDASGAAYVYEKDAGGAWVERAKLTAGDGEAGDLFGHAVAVSGGVIAVGAYRDDDRGNNAGAVYVFEGAGAQWRMVAKLTAADQAELDFFGFSVAISGQTIAVGARLHDETAQDAGAAYLFERTDDAWVEFAKVLAPDGVAADGFGFALALDGPTLVGSSYAELPMGNSGATYVFEREAR